MRINKYYFFVCIYFFVNSVGLPYGLLYTMILTPLFYVWIVLKGKKHILLKFFTFFTPFIFFHIVQGVDVYYYVRSLVIFFTVYIFCYAFYTFISTNAKLEEIIKKIAITNFAFAVLALLFVFTPYRYFFWESWSISVGALSVDKWPRLYGFTYEPSYYSTLLVPVFAFYFIKFILRQSDKDNFKLLLFVVVSLTLSFSMGVISSLVITTFFLFFLNASKFLTNKRLFYSLSILMISLAVTVIFLFVFFGDNPFFVRIIAIVNGQDGSANGRTYQAFHLAYIIADLKSIWWGVGPGQLKILGDSVIKTFYNYPPDYGQVSIPSAFPETLALFGFVGVFVRLSVEFYFFIKTKVLSNYYRTFLFFYIFVYQFTGSFNTNITEYAIWIFAFTNTFPSFDKTNKDELLA
jgi:hypothetical protein